MYVENGFYSGTTVDEVSLLVKKHNDFEKLMATQEEKVIQLQEHGDKLLAQNHFESSLIAKRMTEVLSRREHVKELCQLRCMRLEDALLHAQFVRDVAEVFLNINIVLLIKFNISVNNIL